MFVKSPDQSACGRGHYREEGVGEEGWGGEEKAGEGGEEREREREKQGWWSEREARMVEREREGWWREREREIRRGGFLCFQV